MPDKPTWFVRLTHPDAPDKAGWGECSTIAGLSRDAVPGYADMLHALAARISTIADLTDILTWPELDDFPSIRMGLETAIADWQHGGTRTPFPGPFAQGQPIPINGLIWMGDKTFMFKQIQEKLDKGFTCLKLKIGGIDWQDELDLLAYIRRQFDARVLSLRVDANGAFAPAEAMQKLEQLSDFQIHSIEQPIRQGQWEAMTLLCRQSPVPVALDEELIAVRTPEAQAMLLDTLRPPYIILKPSLMGGFAFCDGWIKQAEARGIGWWITSALEANIGLNAICQFVSHYAPTIPQGLGTGQLYTNNISAPLSVEKGFIRLTHDTSWQLPA